MSMIKIDGSFHEGGGQILRTALGLSALMKQPFEIEKIRSNRPEPGLKPQHLSCVKAAAELCTASHEGTEISSTAVKFYPRDIKARTLSVDIGTAGAITLLLQSLIVPLVFSGKKFRVKITGGTDVQFSPTSSYFSDVLLPQLRKYCDEVTYDVSRRGFFPEGGGKAELFIKPKFCMADYPTFQEFAEAIRNETTQINLLKQNKLLQIKGTSIASSDLEKGEVAERQAKAAKL